MRKWLAAGVVATVTLLSLCAGARAQEYPSVHVHDSRRSASEHLGPTDRVPEPRERMGPGVVGRALRDDRRPMHARRSLHLRVQGGPSMTGRPERLGSLDGGARDAADRPERDLGRDVGSQREPRAGHGSADRCHRPADALGPEQPPLGLLRRCWQAAHSSLRFSPRSWFEIRWTCLDQCTTDLRRLRSTRTCCRPQFDVDDSSPPVGGITGSATDAQTWSGQMRFGLNAADVGGGLFRAVVELDGADALSVADRRRSGELP